MARYVGHAIVDSLKGNESASKGMAWECQLSSLAGEDIARSCSSIKFRLPLQVSGCRYKVLSFSFKIL